MLRTAAENLTRRDCSICRVLDARQGAIASEKNPRSAGTAVLVSDQGKDFGFALTCWHNFDPEFREGHFTGERALPGIWLLPPRCDISDEEKEKQQRRPAIIVGQWSNPIQDFAVLKIPRAVIDEFRLRPAQVSFHIHPGMPLWVVGFHRPGDLAEPDHISVKVTDSADVLKEREGGQCVFEVESSRMIPWDTGMSGGAIFEKTSMALVGLAALVAPNETGSEVYRGYGVPLSVVAETWCRLEYYCHMVKPSPLRRLDMIVASCALIAILLTVLAVCMAWIQTSKWTLIEDTDKRKVEAQPAETSRHVHATGSPAATGDNILFDGREGWPRGQRAPDRFEKRFGSSSRGCDELGRHSAPVWCLAFSPDGTQALSGGLDGTLGLWDLENRSAIRRLLGHTSMVYRVAFSPDGRRGVSGAADGTCRFWDLETGKEIGRLNPRIWLNDVKDRTFLGLCPETQRAFVRTQLWRRLCYLSLCDLTNGHELTRLGIEGQVWDVAFSPCGRRILYCGGFSHDVYIWDTYTHIIRPLRGHTGGVHTIAVCPDRWRALTGSWDNTLRLWDLRTGESIWTLQGHTGHVNCVAVSRDGSRGISGSDDQTVRLWDLVTVP